MENINTKLERLKEVLLNWDDENIRHSEVIDYARGVLEEVRESTINPLLCQQDIQWDIVGELTLKIDDIDALINQLCNKRRRLR